MRALGLQMFLPYKDVVFEIVWSMLDNFSDRRCIVEMLDMISSFSWTIRNIRESDFCLTFISFRE